VRIGAGGVWGLVVAGVCFCGWPEAVAQNSAAGKDAASILRVGVSPVFPPMVFKKEKELAGVEIDLARALAEEMGAEVKFVELPWDEQIEALNKGRIDIIMSSMTITPARQWVVTFSKPYLKVSQMTLVRREDQNAYLFGFPIRPTGTIGTMKSTTGDFLVEREFPKAKRKSFKSEQDAVAALRKKKVDMFISDSTLIWYLAGTHANDGVVGIPIALSEEVLGWATRKSDEKILAAANSFIEKASENGKLNEVYRRWMAIPK
jgi:ABC-type amino acid transport substrate-binding protein